MEDSFNARVGKIFGSLNSSPSSPAALSSLWSLTDDEVERKQWSRREESERNEEIEKDIEEEEEEEHEDKASQSKKPADYNDEEWELKSSIGLDCTLDFEEEEDEYDKVAVEDEDRVYMKEVADDGIDIDSRHQLPASVEEVAVKDPRANHSAARLRLIEDAAQGPLNPKSILKRKGGQPQESDSKPSKRVRFDPNCVCDHGGSDDRNDHRNAASIPDYLLNPSRYTHYTFDSSSDLDDSSNQQAYMDFLKKRREGEGEGEDALSRPVTFIPRKKAGDTTAMVDSCTQLVQQVGIGNLVLPTAIAAAQETSVCAMEEDEQPPSHNTKPARKYRLKPVSESQD